jgi:lambda family phage portal protein
MIPVISKTNGKGNGAARSRIRHAWNAAPNTQSVMAWQPGFGNRYGYGQYGASNRKIALEAWYAVSGDADHDIIYNLSLLRHRSRDLFMGAPVAAAAIITLRTSVIGNGLTQMPQVDADVLGMDANAAAGINKFISQEFNLFADTVECDWSRRLTFRQQQDIVFVNQAISGDVLALLPMKQRRGSIYDLKVRLIEADRVANPITAVNFQPGALTADGTAKVFGGVELTSDAEVDAYWVSRTYPYMPGWSTLPDNFTRVPAFGPESGRPNALLVGEFERPEQRRGVPLFAKCLTELKQLQRYIESVTVQNVIKSYFTSFISSQMPSTDMFQGLVDDEVLSDLIVRRSPYEVKLGPGVINWLRPGDSISFPVNAGPDQNFEAYVVALCKIIGACVGVPYEILLKTFVGSYSASRAALLEFWRRVKVLRQMIIDQFCQPVYEAWMMEAVARGIINAPGFFDDPRVFKAWTRCAWSGSSPGSIDPLKEMMASQLKLKTGVSTLERECLEINGSDWRDNTVQQGIEAELADQHGLPYIRLQDAKDIPIVVDGSGEPVLPGRDIEGETQ